MIEKKLKALIREAVSGAAADLGAEPPVEIELIRPPQKRFGDFSTNVAMAWGARLKRNPGEVAAAIVHQMPKADFLSSAEVAPPGFINFHVVHLWLYDVLREVVARGDSFGLLDPTGERAQVEFVSANPTGPLHVGHARNTALGDAIASILEAAGFGVEREYYWNDSGTQMELLGQSVEARYLARFGVPAEVPENGYHGEYVDDVAAQIAEEVGDRFVHEEPEARRKWFVEESRRRMIEWIRSTLDRFGVHFDSWFSEAYLEQSGAVEEAVKLLRQKGFAYDADGAVWFRSTEFGDDKDRVLIRSNGAPTYFAKDVAYLRDKFGRGFDRLVYVWGADHHGDVVRVRGAAQALGYDPEAMEFVLYQFVSLYRGGQPVKMSKRAGDLITLDELLDEVGADAARYALLARSSDSPINFDIEEVSRQSLENPVYYVQYAHARIASIIRHASERGIDLAPIDSVDLERLDAEAELDLLRKISELPEEVEVAANLRAPYRLARYVEDLAALFHRFYTECRVVTDDAALTQARLWLCVAAKQAIANVLGLLGVSAPEAMERVDEDTEATDDSGVTERSGAAEGSGTGA
ncbi:MAG: arginine--tRNA ligase [Actinomycetota bacterium]|nr:arginine--tRNA ligase [Actinomycetota bacterium]